MPILRAVPDNFDPTPGGEAAPARFRRVVRGVEVRRRMVRSVVVVLSGSACLAGCGGTTATVDRALLPGAAVPAAARGACAADKPVRLPGVMYGPSSARSGPGAAVIASGQAARVVRAFWALEERASACDEIAVTDQIEMGPAREFANAVSRGDRAVHAVSLRTVRPLYSVHVYVPFQTGYPARFLAQVVTTTYTRVDLGNGGPPPGSPAVEILVFVRSGLGSPWKAAIDTIRTETTYVDANTVGQNGFEAPPPHPDWVAPSAVPGMLAHYWTEWLDTGHEPVRDPFVPGPATTQFGRQLAASPAFDLSRGSISRAFYYADPALDGLYQFAVDGQNLTCFAVRYHLTLTPAIAGHFLLQDSARTHYGRLLPAGGYSSIDEGGLHQSCALIPTQGSHRRIIIIGMQGGYASESGQTVGSTPL